MEKSTAAKMGIKENMRAFLLNAPEESVDAIRLPSLELDSNLIGEFDYIHFFVNSQAEFHQHFPELKEHLKPGGMLWVSWLKAGQQGTDLTLTTVIKIGYDYGLVESKTLSIDATWSAIKFTHPKPGKVYQNSYGKLK